MSWWGSGGPVGGNARWAAVAVCGGVLLAACGRATASGAAGGAAGSLPQLNPAERAAFEIVRLQTIVPFTSAQAQQLEPLLRSLIRDPNVSAGVLAADAKKITAVFTPTQDTAIKNAGLGSVTAAAPFGAAAPARRRFGGPRAHGTGPRFSGPRNGKRRAFNGSFAYTLALDALKGRQPSFFRHRANAGGASAAPPRTSSPNSGSGATAAV